MMPTPPSRQPISVATTVSFSPKQGPVPKLTLPTNPAPPPFQQTSHVVGADSVSFTVGPRQTITVTFPNLPERTTTNPCSPLQAQTSQIAVDSFNTLHFSVALQGVTGDTPTVTPQVRDAKGVYVPGPFLGGNVYETFQAVIVGGSTGSTGTVVGTATLMVQS